MNPINLYSSVLVGLVVLALAGRFLLRHGVSVESVLALVLLAAGLFAAWWATRPSQTQHKGLAQLRSQIGAGKYVLLELQSPY